MVHFRNSHCERRLVDFYANRLQWDPMPSHLFVYSFESFTILKVSLFDLCHFLLFDFLGLTYRRVRKELGYFHFFSYFCVSMLIFAHLLRWISPLLLCESPPSEKPSLGDQSQRRFREKKTSCINNGTDQMRCTNKAKAN